MVNLYRNLLLILLIGECLLGLLYAFYPPIRGYIAGHWAVIMVAFVVVGLREMMEKKRG